MQLDLVSLRSIHLFFPRLKIFMNDKHVSGGRGAPAQQNDRSGAVAGRNAVRELLRSGRSVDKIFVSGRDGSVRSIITEARKLGIPVVNADSSKLDRLACGAVHQGVVAFASEKSYSTVDEILSAAASKGEPPLIAIADGIEDPHNLGALIRSAECSGCHGVIIPKRRSSGLTPVAVKASAGAVWHIPVARVTNIAETVALLKERGIWTFAAEAGGDDCFKTDFDLPAAFVFGSEGGGVSRLASERCDFTVSIPMYGHVNSFNVSAAAAVILSLAARARRLGSNI